MFKDPKFQAVIQILIIVAIFFIIIIGVVFGLVKVAEMSPFCDNSNHSMVCQVHEMKVCVDSQLYTQLQCADMVAAKFENKVIPTATIVAK